jgi:predicted anti-sigma-YlaC factor YlaD
MSLRLDGLLEPPDIARLDDHLQRCPACRDQWAALRQADSLLRGAGRHPIAAPVDFSARLMERVAATPVARPHLWDRERQQVQGGRPTVKLNAPSPITGQRVAPPAGIAAVPAPRGGLLGRLQPRAGSRVGVYLGGLSVAGVFSMLMLIMVGLLWANGGAPAPATAQLLPPGALSDSMSTWLAAGWTLLSGAVTQIDPWIAATATIVLVGLGAAWWRIVAAVARRAGRREMLT